MTDRTVVEWKCYCDDCEKTKLVDRVKITRGGKMLLWLKCGHRFGFVFLEKLVQVKKGRVCANCGKVKPLLPNGLCVECTKKLAKKS